MTVADETIMRIIESTPASFSGLQDGGILLAVIALMIIVHVLTPKRTKIVYRDEKHHPHRP